jgi:hypothetical protein
LDEDFGWIDHSAGKTGGVDCAKCGSYLNDDRPQQLGCKTRSAGRREERSVNMDEIFFLTDSSRGSPTRYRDSIGWHRGKYSDTKTTAVGKTSA